MTTRKRIKILQVEERTGLHRQTIYRQYKNGDFPQPHYLGRDRQWFEDEIEAWELRTMAKRVGQSSEVPMGNAPDLPPAA